MKRKKINKFTLLLILLLGVTLGYALVTTTLKITGTTGLSKHSWDVYWTNVVVNQNCSTPSVTPTIGPSTGNNKNTKVTFVATLTFPGDYYEFTVDAVNNGDIDAMVSAIDPVVSPTLPNYIKYEITYDDGGTPAIYDKLAKKSGNEPTIKTYKIKVWYDEALATDETVNDMTEDSEYRFDLGITYELATAEAMTPLERKMVAVLANPNAYRNTNQSVSNKDIGIDENGDVINLDDWTYTNQWGVYKYYYQSYLGDYYHPTYIDEISFGDCGGTPTIATASERIVDGKMTTPIPSYILLEGKSEFYPVTSLACIFGDTVRHGRTKITEFPDLPKTVTNIGGGLFWGLGTFEEIEIPKHIKTISYDAFNEAFKQSGTNNRVTFERGSKLEFIGERAFQGNNLKSPLELPSTVTRIYYSAFQDNSLSGNLILPQGMTLIEKEAFKNNNLTSVTFPSTATYTTNCVSNYGESCDSFDASVTINHNY